jgi:hypothetical protein
MAAETIAGFLLWVIFIYLCCGIIFTIAFQAKGIHKIDEGAHGSSWGFRVIIIPGVIVFWPFLLKKWMNAKKEIIGPADEHL